MKKSFLKSLRSGAASLALSVALVSSSVGVAEFAMIAPAFAATSLTTSQTFSLQTSLTAAIQIANGDPAAIELAISTAAQNALATYGADAAASITSAILTIAESAGATNLEIGIGLGQASAIIATANIGAASVIASTLANEGKADEIAAYETTTSSLGYASLASIAGGSPSATSQTGGNLTSTNTGNFSGGSSGSGGGCLNPSCTSL
ncbi:MAG: hypothetical protein WDM86_07455 [Rhizomicrobium sp.]